MALPWWMNWTARANPAMPASTGSPFLSLMARMASRIIAPVTCSASSRLCRFIACNVASISDMAASYADESRKAGGWPVSALRSSLNTRPELPSPSTACEVPSWPSKSPGNASNTRWARKLCVCKSRTLVPDSIYALVNLISNFANEMVTTVSGTPSFLPVFSLCLSINFLTSAAQLYSPGTALTSWKICSTDARGASSRMSFLSESAKPRP